MSSLGSHVNKDSSLKKPIATHKHLKLYALYSSALVITIFRESSKIITVINDSLLLGTHTFKTEVLCLVSNVQLRSSMPFTVK